MEKKEGLKLPPLAQVGYVVKDLEKAIEYYSKVFGVGPFMTLMFAPEKRLLRGKPVSIMLKIGIAPMGPVQMELIEPVKGDGIHKEYLETRGEGLQHLGFIVDNYDEWLAYMKEQDIEILEEAETTVPGMGHIRAMYTQSDRMCGVPLEFIEVTPE
jgi:methylmalonyl-CoA/ethylmalonyl-CoA epimerase